MRTLGARPLRLPARVRNLDGLDGVVHRVVAIDTEAWMSMVRTS